MKFETGTRSSAWLRRTLHEILQPGEAVAVPAAGQSVGQWTRQGIAIVLSALMIMIPLAQGSAFAQAPPVPMPPEAAPPSPPLETPPVANGPAADNDQPLPQGQALSADQLDQLVAPIALYPDALVAQILAASTYPTQVVEADRWRKAQGNAPADQIAAGAENHNWDPSVKALTAFPTVLAQLDVNIRWTTDLGNAYYNQPQDVMDSIQAMRQKAQNAGQLRSTPQQVVSNDNGAVVIAPANPTVVYVPVYDPWTVWGTPFAPFPGYYYYPPAGVFWGGLAIGFGIGIGIGFFGHWGWGWGHWGLGWGPRWGYHGVAFNRATYVTHSTTVINRGVNRPGGPSRSFAARGAYARPGGVNRASVNRGGTYRGNTSYRGNTAVRGNTGANNTHSNGVNNRSSVNSNRSSYRAQTNTGPAANSRASVSNGAARSGSPSYSVRPNSSSGAHPSGGGGHPSSGGGGGHPSGGGGHSGGGHSGGGGHGGGGHEGR